MMLAAQQLYTSDSRSESSCSRADDGVTPLKRRHVAFFSLPRPIVTMAALMQSSREKTHLGSVDISLSAGSMMNGGRSSRTNCSSIWSSTSMSNIGTSSCGNESRLPMPRALAVVSPAQAVRGTSPLLTLPDQLLLHIAAHLSSEDRYYGLRMVSRRFHALMRLPNPYCVGLPQTPACILALPRDNIQEVLVHTAVLTTKYNGIEFSLRALDCRALKEDMIAAHVSGLQKLHSMQLHFCDEITPSMRKTIQAVPRVMLHKTGALPECPKLFGNTRYLSLSQMINVGEVLFRDCSQLQHLELAFSSDVTDELVTHVWRLPQLKSLSLVGLSGVTDKGLEALAEDHPMRDISRMCVRLSQLAKVTSYGVGRVLSTLQNVALIELNINDTAFVDLMQTIQYLCLENLPNVSDAALCNLGSVHRFDIAGLDITDRGLKMMSNVKCATLKRLPKVTSAGLAELGHCDELSLKNLCVDDDRFLARYAGVRKLELDTVSGITSFGLNMLGECVNARRPSDRLRVLKLNNISGGTHKKLKTFPVPVQIVK